MRHAILGGNVGTSAVQNTEIPVGPYHILPYAVRYHVDPVRYGLWYGGVSAVRNVVRGSCSDNYEDDRYQEDETCFVTLAAKDHQPYRSTAVRRGQSSSEYGTGGSVRYRVGSAI